MPDDPADRPTDAGPDPSGDGPGPGGAPAGPTNDVSAVPTEEELMRVAEPARVRRAPRYRAFVVAGALVGTVLALLAVTLVGDPRALAGAGGGLIPALDGAGAVRAVVGVAGALVGGLVGGALALLADRRSRRR